MIKKLVLTTVTAATVALSVGVMTSSAEAHSIHHWRHRPGVHLFFGAPLIYPHYWRSCHQTKVWFKHHWHKARVCNGHIVKVW